MIIVLMGVSGSGKSAVGVTLANALGVAFVEGAAFHPPANIAKMSSGLPLDDTDRRPWITAIADALNTLPIASKTADNSSNTSCIAVLACSALSVATRTRLRSLMHQSCQFVHLQGDRTVIAQRLHARNGHFMPMTLLDSQIAELQIPDDAWTVPADQPIDAIVTTLLKRIALQQP